jgi:hypothetical protein
LSRIICTEAAFALADKTSGRRHLPKRLILSPGRYYRTIFTRIPDINEESKTNASRIFFLSHNPLPSW